MLLEPFHSKTKLMKKYLKYIFKYRYRPVLIGQSRKRRVVLGQSRGLQVLTSCLVSSTSCACRRPLDREAMFLTPALGREIPFLATPLAPILSSTPCNITPQVGVSVRKRRRLAASPGGLHWTSTGTHWPNYLSVSLAISLSLSVSLLMSHASFFSFSRLYNYYLCLLSLSASSIFLSVSFSLSFCQPPSQYLSFSFSLLLSIFLCQPPSLYLCQVG